MLGWFYVFSNGKCLKLLRFNYKSLLILLIHIEIRNYVFIDFQSHNFNANSFRGFCSFQVLLSITIYISVSRVLGNVMQNPNAVLYCDQRECIHKLLKDTNN